MGSDRRTGSRKKRLLIGSTAMLLIAAGTGTWFATKSSGAATPGITTTTSVHTVATGTITQTVAATGTIEPASQANLNFAVSGKVTAVSATVGQTVTAGQSLATVDPTALNASLAQAQATLANDQAQLATDQAADASATQIALDNANIASAQTQVTTAQTDVTDATLVSTISGTVASVSLTVGQQVTGSTSSASSGTGSTGSTGTGSTGTGSTGASSLGASSTSAASSSSDTSSSTTAQVVVVSTGSYIVNASVTSTSVSQVQPGDQATITVSGSTTPVYGTVGSVGLLASTTSGVSSFPVVVDVTGSPDGLYGGSSANVSIIVKELQDVVVVPTTAISYTTGAPTVSLDTNGTKSSQPVTVGTASDGSTQIVSGLSVGQKIYVTTISFHGALGTGRSGATGTGGFGGFGGTTGAGGFGGATGAGGFGG